MPIMFYLLILSSFRTREELEKLRKALIFSAFHYVGALGDAFTVSSFVFRAIAGVAFSVLYVTRGFGVTAWTHALYDLGLSLLQAS